MKCAVAARAAHDLARHIPAALAVALAERKALAQRLGGGQARQRLARFAPHLSAMVGSAGNWPTPSATWSIRTARCSSSTSRT
ncbi:MAG: hypothetical protein R2851_24580 [Caldilineaceae bacterium]